MNLITPANAQEEMQTTDVEVQPVSAEVAAPTGEVHASTEVAPADEGLLASLGINGTLFIFQLINFAVVAVVIWFLILKPLTKRLSERQRIIDDSLENAKKVQQNLEQSEKSFKDKLSEAKAAANTIMEKAITEAAQTTEQMKVKAKQEIEVLVEQAKKNIKIEKDEMMLGLKKETAELVVAVVEKILSEKMTDKKDKEMITEMISTIK